MRGEKKLGSKLGSFIFLLELISVEDQNNYVKKKKLINKIQCLCDTSLLNK